MKAYIAIAVIAAMIVISLSPLVIGEDSDAVSSGTATSPLSSFDDDASVVMNQNSDFHIALGSSLRIVNDVSGGIQYKVTEVSSGFGIVIGSTGTYGVLSKTGNF